METIKSKKSSTLTLEELLELDKRSNKYYKTNNKKKKKKKSKKNKKHKKKNKNKNKQKKKNVCLNKIETIDKTTGIKNVHYTYNHRTNKSFLGKLLNSCNVDLRSKLNIDISDTTVNNAINAGLSLLQFLVTRKK